nr:MAG TPA: hypothetical protein [Caudoviricetes sp.]
METITIAKALKTIVLPNGKTVHEGDEFVFEHDFENCGEFEIVGEQNGNNAPAPQQPDKKPEGKDISIAELSAEQMKNIRLKAKNLKIDNWHIKGIARLLSEIAEAEAKPADGITSDTAENKGKEPENTVDGISPEVVVSEMENTTGAPAPQQPVDDNLTPTDGAAGNA